ncbi:sugar phosphate isomerase/epimerase (plasmid) [Pontibacillus sp. ALD_SL1]|uniref:sugar phosphate isomerase/epimerase n=1 Tax=Pontibacillus sp. ALD_SL1 TaxID=2777185 RepID=UPI001A973C80|nr:sugar phosphate isomerase/epimerase [Pontibacillus sp. ALD_SL1]QST02253.1 sugar phosphate isomerase/epimerase [Pontibacillus sp. ALD_SL1]
MSVSHRVKSSTSEKAVLNRLLFSPCTFEFHLTEQDLTPKGILHLEKMITLVQREGARVYLHHPMTYKGKPQHILSPDLERKTYFQWSTKQLVEISREYQTKTVLHGNYHESTPIPINERNTIQLYEELQKYMERGRDHLLFEDSTSGLFSYQNKDLISTVITPLKLPLVQDLSHSFIAVRGDQKRFIDLVHRVHPYVQYYHVVDSFGEYHDSLTIGKGKINWKAVKPYIIERDYIFEVGLRDFDRCDEMVESAYVFHRI